MALGFMRRHRRWLYVFLWLVIAAFIILYIPAFQGAQAGSQGEVLGSVSGLPITVGEFQRSYLQQRQIYERMYQGRVDPAMLKRMGLGEQVFDALVAERVVALEARRLGLSVDDQEVAREIATAPEYQRNGVFIGTAEIKRLLELRGMTAAEFEADLRGALLRRKLETLVAGGVSVTPAEAEREFRRRSEQIKAEYVLVDAARFQPQPSVSEDEVKARYEARKDAYRHPERRVVSYALIDAEALRARVSVTDGEIESAYRERSDDFREPEQACASHILVKIKADEDKTGHSEAEALRIGESLLAQVRGGGDFAALAKKASEDPGSAPNGGDLSCFGRGQMLPEFENATFALEAGAVSDLVRTQYGYHIIKLHSRREEGLRPLPQVKEMLRQRLTQDKVRALADTQAEALSAALRRGAGLEAAAREQGLAVARSVPFGRGELPSPIGSTALNARAFALKPGETEKELFALPTGYAFISLVEVQPPHTPELKDVQDKVRADLLEEKARERARLLAAELRAKAEKQGLEKAAAGAGLVRRETQALVGRGQPIGELGTSAVLDEAAFGLEPKVLSGPIPTSTGFALLRVLEKQAYDPQAFEAQRASLVAALRADKRAQLFQAFVDAARRKLSVERRPDVYKRVAG